MTTPHTTPALPLAQSLECVITWLEGGCNLNLALEELRLLKERVTAAPQEGVSALPGWMERAAQEAEYTAEVRGVASPESPQPLAPPPGYALMPVGLLSRAVDSLGSFVSDHGWAQSDMDTMDELSAMVAAAPPTVVNGDDDEPRRIEDSLTQEDAIQLLCVRDYLDAGDTGSALYALAHFFDHEGCQINPWDRLEARALPWKSEGKPTLVAQPKIAAALPPGRGMVPMTDGQIHAIWQKVPGGWPFPSRDFKILARAIEAHHGISAAGIAALGDGGKRE